MNPHKGHLFVFRRAWFAEQGACGTTAKTRLLSVLFIAYTVFATYLVHHFWTITGGAARAANVVHFNKNCAIIGGLALLFVTGAGAYSLDTLWSRLRGNASMPTRAAAVKS